MDLTVDEGGLETLSSKTRRDILKSLSNQGKTPTFLSKRLDKSKSTIVEHLSKLVDGGFVRKEKKEGRKRVIYFLTRKGENIVRPGRGINVTLIASVLSLSGGLAALCKWLYSSQSFGARMAQEIAKAPSNTTAPVQTPSTPWTLMAGIVLFLAGSAGMIYWARKG